MSDASDDYLRYMLEWPEPLLPEIIPSKLVEWRWDGLWQTRTADFGWFRLVSSRPFFNYQQKALAAGGSTT